MKISAKDIDDFLKKENVKLPYTKKLTNGMWEVFDGKSICYMPQALYDKFQAKMLEFGTKGLNKKI